MKKYILALLLITSFGCSYLAVQFTPKKKHTLIQTDLGKKADEFFWNQYHQGNYDSIPQIINLLNQALQENPNDLKTNAHLGFVHVWALSERQRLTEAEASVTEHISLSRRYFSEANQMNPHDPRILGFLADLTLAEGSQFNNKKQQTQGFFIGLKSIRKWPQFNKFTLGYILSNLDTTDKNFTKGLEWQYQTIDDCACEKNTRKTDYSEAIEKIKKSTSPMIHRACWNTWIAPHNWEGFCLNWGDMLVKAGKTEEAVKIYNLARKSDSYNEWPFKTELENRIQHVEQNVKDFNAPINNTQLHRQNVIMFNSIMSCTGCHQMSKNEFKAMGYQHLESNYYFIKDKK
jgi:tetratricopeptide (TPR) repeat protein